MTLPRPVLPLDPPQPLGPLDPSAPAEAPGCLFGFDIPLAQAGLLAVSVPYEATVSSRGGTADGPRALIDASSQVDLFDVWAEEPWSRGLAAIPESAAIRDLSAAAREWAEAARDGNAEARARVDAAGREVWAWLEEVCSSIWAGGRIPLVLGGEHSVSLGAFRAAAARYPGFGLLQIDAHADLRAAYEGFLTSHASVMRRALELPGIERLIQVGLRDLSREEFEAKQEAGNRVVWFTDRDLAGRLFSGETWAAITQSILESLPQSVWISFDIDGLEAGLAPGTGTPVPGGLTFREAAWLLSALRASGRRVIGADLVEVGPEYWDGYVAAKLLYLLAGVVS